MYSTDDSSDHGIRRRVLSAEGVDRSDLGFGRRRAATMRVVRFGGTAMEEEGEDIWTDGMLAQRGASESAVFGKRGRWRQKQGQGQSENRRRLRVSGAMLAYQAAQNALEDLVSVSAGRYTC